MRAYGDRLSLNRVASWVKGAGKAVLATATTDNSHSFLPFPSSACCAQYELFTKFEKMLTLPLLVLTTLTGVLSSLQAGLGSNVNMSKSVSTVVAVTGCVSAIVHTLNQHLAFAARAEKSLGLSKSYQNVASKIEAELNLMKSEAASSSSSGGAKAGGIGGALHGGLEGVAGMLPVKLPGMGGEGSAAPSGSGGGSAAAGPTTATKQKFLQMIQTEIAQLDGSIDDMPAALATVAEAAVGFAAVTACCGCFKRHTPVNKPPLLPGLKIPAFDGKNGDADAERNGEEDDHDRFMHPGSRQPSRNTSRSGMKPPSVHGEAEPAAEKPPAARARPKRPSMRTQPEEEGAPKQESRRGLEDVL